MTTHTFQPTRYYTTMGTHEPALHIAPGDTVITTTVDAAGRDASNEQVTPRGNPMTGPFFIEGAELGDTLVVELDKIVPNRTQGWGSAMLAPNVVDPNYVPQLPWPPAGEPSRSYWHVDVEAGTVTLDKPVDQHRPLHHAHSAHDRLFWRGPGRRRGHLHCDLGRPWRQHGLPSLRRRQDRLLPGLCTLARSSSLATVMRSRAMARWWALALRSRATSSSRRSAQRADHPLAARRG
jgi:hypothetical protein